MSQILACLLKVGRNIGLIRRPRVWVIEEDSEDIQMYGKGFEGKVEATYFTNLFSVMSSFCDQKVAWPEIMIFDGLVNEEPTIGLVKKIRDHGYKGIMVAASSDTLLNKLLMKAGCNSSIRPAKPESVYADKTDAIKLALSLLGLDHGL